MTAAQHPTQPNPLDAVKYLVLFIADQLSDIGDQIAGRLEGDDSCEVACDWLDSLRNEVQAMLIPFFSRRLPNTLPRQLPDGSYDLTDDKVFVPLYSDGRAPYEDVELRSGITARNWQLPTGYPQKPPVDWDALYPAVLAVVPDVDETDNDPAPATASALDESLILVNEGGEPLGVIRPAEIIDAGTELAFKMAANCGDPAALERIGAEALAKAGPAGFGYVAASALRQLAEHILDPALTAGEAAGVNLRDGLTAFAEGRDPETGGQK